MAGNHHRPKDHAVQRRMKSERHLKVSSKHTERKHQSPERSPAVTWLAVPQIRMQGKWLAQAGFHSRAMVRVRVMKGCLILTID